MPTPDGTTRAAARERLALVGDVHGNATAFRAVLEAVAAAGITDGLNTGDVVMRGAEPVEAIRLTRETGWPVVVGNTDEKVGAGRPRPKGHPASDRPGSRSWTIRRISDDDREWLAALPRRVEVMLGGHRIVLAHGQPGDLPVVVDEETPDQELARLAARLRAQAVVVGHTHRPMVRRAGGCLFVNPGSVGEGTEEDRRPSWAWLEVRRGRLEAHLARVEAPLAPPRVR